MKDKNLAIIVHAVGFFGCFILPFGSILLPFLMLVFLKDESKPLFNKAAKEAMNFQISIAVYTGLLYMLLIAVVSMLGISALFDDIGLLFMTGFGVMAILLFFVLVLMTVIDIIFVFVAMYKASNEVEYRYPLTFRLVK